MKISDMIKELEERVDDLDYCSRQLSLTYLDKLTKVSQLSDDEHEKADRYVRAINYLWEARDGLRAYLNTIGTDLPIDWSQTWEKG